MSSVESWEIAKNYGSLLGAVPSSFSSAIRALILDNEKLSGAVSAPTRTAATRLFQGPSSKLALQTATALYRPRSGLSLSSAASKDLVNLYSASELSALIGGLYLYRRCRKRVPSEVWGVLGAIMQRNFDTGFFVGTALPNVGPGIGALAASIRSVALGTYVIHDAKGYGDYDRMLQKKKLPYDEQWEMERWGCTSSQICSVLTQALGFGPQFANLIYSALSLPDDKLDVDDAALYRLKIANFWVITLLESGKEPQMTHRGEYYPMKAALDTLLLQVASVRAGTCPSWLAIRADAPATPAETVEGSEEIE